MSIEDARKWRHAIERRLEVRGVLPGQALEHLPRELDLLWFRRFLNGTTNSISRTMMEDIFLTLGPNWKARGERYTRQSLIHHTDEELLDQFSMDPKLSDD